MVVFVFDCGFGFVWYVEFVFLFEVVGMFKLGNVDCWCDFLDLYFE